MNCSTKPETPEGGESGFGIEHVLLSVTVVHTNRIMQYDDSCARLLEIHLKEYAGVVRVNAKVQYDHTKTDIHLKGCECGICKPLGDCTPTLTKFQ